MSSASLSSDSFIDDLIARRTGSQRVVSIPGFQELSKAEQAVICAKLDQSQDAPAVDAVALQARLQTLFSVPGTDLSLLSLPPLSPSTASTTLPDPEDETKRYHQLEEQACNLLEQNGCPPCYPFDPSFTMRKTPEEYREIISYWDTFPSSEGGALCAQWEDWSKFRTFQGKNRRYYTQRFAQFTKKVRERRRRHNLPEDICLRFNPQEQTRLENWVEFQDYHLHVHEDLEKKVEAESKDLEAATEKLQGAVDSEFELATKCEEACNVRLASAIQKMESHEKLLLPWIERQRMKMITTQFATTDNINGIQREPTPRTRNRTPKVRSVLNPVRSAVSKPDLRKPSLRNRRPELSPRPEESTFDSKTSQSNTTQTRHLRRQEPQKTRRSAPFRPVHSQKVTKPVKRDSKSKRPANLDSSPRLLPQSRKAEQRKPKQRGRPLGSRSVHQDLTVDFVTKNGRTSRRPKRPGFILCR